MDPGVVIPALINGKSFNCLTLRIKRFNELALKSWTKDMYHIHTYLSQLLSAKPLRGRWGNTPPPIYIKKIAQSGYGSTYSFFVNEICCIHGVWNKIEKGSTRPALSYDYTCSTGTVLHLNKKYALPNCLMYKYRVHVFKIGYCIYYTGKNRLNNSEQKHFLGCKNIGNTNVFFII